jgi:hypothetical protein
MKEWKELSNKKVMGRRRRHVCVCVHVCVVCVHVCVYMCVYVRVYRSPDALEVTDTNSPFAGARRNTYLRTNIV